MMIRFNNVGFKQVFVDTARNSELLKMGENSYELCFSTADGDHCCTINMSRAEVGNVYHQLARIVPKAMVKGKAFAGRDG